MPPKTLHGLHFVPRPGRNWRKTRIVDDFGISPWLESGTVDDSGANLWLESGTVDDSGMTPWHEMRAVDDSADGGWHDIERASYRTGVKGPESKDWIVWLVWWVYACQTKVL